MSTNTPSPLIPQGALVTGQGRSHIRIAVFTILAIHVVLLGALLLQGCKRSTEPDATAAAEPTNAFSHLELPPLPPLPNSTTLTQQMPLPTASQPGIPAIQSSVPPDLLPASASIPEVPAPPPEDSPTLNPTATGTSRFAEHTIVRGDTFSGLADKYGTTVKAIAEANPSVDPRRLQPGKTILIPPAPTAVATASTTTAEAGQSLYTVKSGDNLTRIAGQFNTTVKDIMSANNLTTTKIRVGDKLIIPKP